MMPVTKPLKDRLPRQIAVYTDKNPELWIKVRRICMEKKLTLQEVIEYALKEFLERRVEFERQAEKTSTRKTIHNVPRL